MSPGRHLKQKNNTDIQMTELSVPTWHTNAEALLLPATANNLDQSDYENLLIELANNDRWDLALAVIIKRNMVDDLTVDFLKIAILREQLSIIKILFASTVDKLIINHVKARYSDENGFYPNSPIRFLRENGRWSNALILKRDGDDVLVKCLSNLNSYWLNLPTNRHRFGLPEAEEKSDGKVNLLLEHLEKTFLQALDASDWAFVCQILIKLSKEIRLSGEFLSALLLRALETNAEENFISNILGLGAVVTTQHIVMAQGKHNTDWIRKISNNNRVDLLYCAAYTGKLEVIKIFCGYNLINQDILQNLLIIFLNNKHLKGVALLDPFGADIAAINLKTINQPEVNLPLGLEPGVKCNALSEKMGWRRGVVVERRGDRVLVNFDTIETSEWFSLSKHPRTLAPENTLSSQNPTRFSLNQMLEDTFLLIKDLADLEFVCRNIIYLSAMISFTEVFFSALFTKALDLDAPPERINFLLMKNFPLLPSHLRQSLSLNSDKVLSTIMTKTELTHPGAVLQAAREGKWGNVIFYLNCHSPTTKMINDLILIAYDQSENEYRALKKFIAVDNTCSYQLQLNEALLACLLDAYKFNYAKLAIILFDVRQMKIPEELLLKSTSKQEWEFCLEYLRNVNCAPSFIFALIECALGKNNFMIAIALLNIPEFKELADIKTDVVMRLVKYCGELAVDIINQPGNVISIYNLFSQEKSALEIKFKAAVKIIKYLVTDEINLSEAEKKVLHDSDLSMILRSANPTILPPDFNYHGVQGNHVLHVLG